MRRRERINQGRRLAWMAIIHSPVVATVVFGGPAVMAGIGMVMALHARWRRTGKSLEFWKQIGVQALLIIMGLTALAITIQDYYRHLPPDHSCLSDFNDDGYPRTSWSLFARSCY
jgi:hypothetical protein